MFNYLFFRWIFYLFTLLFIVKYGDTRAVDSQPGLYNSSDNVVVLNYTNFNSTIYQSNNTAYLVEFYSSWCGFCQNFAPKWKSLANDIIEWKDVVKVAAIDCSNDDNNPICREYEIMSYPTVRYFSPNDKTRGINIEKGQTIDYIRHQLVRKLQDDQQKEKGNSWPNLTPFRTDELKDVWRAAPESVKYYFFIFDTINSTLGTEIILDMHKINTIKIRTIKSDHSSLRIMYKVEGKFPTVMVMDRKNEETKLDIPVTATRIELSNVINKFLEKNGIIEKKKTTIDDISNTISSSNKNILENKKYQEKDVVYQADLDYALRYSLEKEIPLKPLIEGVKLEALKNYIKVLSKYFPKKRGNSDYLPSIYNKIKDLTTIKGKEFLKIVKSLEEKLSPVYTEEKKWIGCEGSKIHYRGYPCGLWTLFHTLTVNHAAEDEDEEIEGHQPTEVLGAIYGYVQNFFGCADCVQHFISMADEHKLFEVEFTDDAILWLWRAHNIVNIRLSGDESEDPEFPKIRYPPREHCEPCRHHDYSWNEDEILIYLKHKYGYSGINYHNEIKSSSINDDIFEARNKKSVWQENNNINNNNTTVKKFRWNFTIFDISICVVLYIVSLVILILVCVKFVFKRSGKKKISINPLLTRA